MGFTMRKLLIEAKAFESESRRLLKVYGKAIASKDMSPKDALWFMSDLNKALLFNGENENVMSPYTEWLFANLIKGPMKQMKEVVDGDKGKEVIEALRVYDDAKRKNKLAKMDLPQNLMQVSIDKLCFLCKTGSQDSLSSNQQKLDKLGDTYEVVYKDKKGCILSMYTWNANRVIGSNSKWCTVANFNHYSMYSSVYYVICPLDKYGSPDITSKDRIQFHITSEGPSMMNVYDVSVNIGDVVRMYGRELAEFIMNELVYGQLDKNCKNKGVNVKKKYVDEMTMQINDFLESNYGFNIDDVYDVLMKHGIMHDKSFIESVVANNHSFDHGEKITFQLGSDAIPIPSVERDYNGEQFADKLEVSVINDRLYFKIGCASAYNLTTCAIIANRMAKAYAAVMRLNINNCGSLGGSTYRYVGVESCSDNRVVFNFYWVGVKKSSGSVIKNSTPIAYDAKTDTFSISDPSINQSFSGDETELQSAIRLNISLNTRE